MDKLKIIITTGPFFAVSIAIAYLQGYWGAFDINAIPELTIQEIIGYATTPFFAFVTFAIFLLPIFFTKLPNFLEKKLPFHYLIILNCVFGIVGLLLGLSSRWYMFFIIVMLVVIAILERKAVQPSIEELFLGILIIALFGAFVLGRVSAEEIITKTTPNTEIKTDFDNLNVKLIGKLDNSYYYMNLNTSRVTTIPKQAVHQIEFSKKYEVRNYLLSYFN